MGRMIKIIFLILSLPMKSNIYRQYSCTWDRGVYFMKNLIIVLLLLMPMLWLISCDDESKETDFNPNISASKDYVRAEDAIMEIVNSFFKGINDSLVVNNGYGFIDACDVSYHPSENYINFGYGTMDRFCQDGKMRRGLFSAAFTGQLFGDWTVADIVTDSLFVEDVLIEADMEIQKLGVNENNLPEFSLKVISSNIMLTDTAKIYGVRLTTDYILVWAEGSNTVPVHEDDLYLISGTAAGISATGIQFSTVVQEPLYDYVDCFWISRGIDRITVPSSSFPTGDIDYITEDGCFNQMNFYFDDNLFYDVIK
jgi:hypothetical protein